MGEETNWQKNNHLGKSTKNTGWSLIHFKRCPTAADNYIVSVFFLNFDSNIFIEKYGKSHLTLHLIVIMSTVVRNRSDFAIICFDEVRLETKWKTVFLSEAYQLKFLLLEKIELWSNWSERIYSLLTSICMSRTTLIWALVLIHITKVFSCVRILERKFRIVFSTFWRSKSDILIV